MASKRELIMTQGWEVVIVNEISSPYRVVLKIGNKRDMVIIARCCKT